MWLDPSIGIVLCSQRGYLGKSCRSSPRPYMNDINYEHVLFGLLLISEYGHHRNGLGLFHWPASVLPTGALNFAGAMIRRIIFKFAVRSGVA
jgi:hypothetical protein